MGPTRTGVVLDHWGEWVLSRQAARLSLKKGGRDVGLSPSRADGTWEERLLQSVDDETRELIARRRQSRKSKDRGWLLRRLLLAGTYSACPWALSWRQSPRGCMGSTPGSASQSS